MPQMLTDDEKKRLFMTLDAQTEQLKRLEQGMYGDDKLRIKGLLDDMVEVKAWILAHKLKMTFLSGIGAALGFLATKIWEWVIAIHTK